MILDLFGIFLFIILNKIMFIQKFEQSKKKKKINSYFIHCRFYKLKIFWSNVLIRVIFQLTMNDFSVHRIIGRGGFGEVYGCRKADTGKMYAMKCLDKKRIKMKQGETLALNERIMLSLVSTGVRIIIY